MLTPRFTTDDDDTMLDFDQWRAATINDDHSLAAPNSGAAAALFVNAAAGDYRLKPGALGLDAGTSTQAPGVDFFGVARPQGSGYDIGAIETVAGATLAADFNGDNSVNAADFAAWRGGFGTAIGAAKATGDANADGDVDGADFLAWQSQIGTAAVSQIPEPASSVFLALAYIGCSLRRGIVQRCARNGWRGIAACHGLLAHRCEPGGTATLHFPMKWRTMYP